MNTFYIIPIWWIGVSLFGNIWTQHQEVLPKVQILLLLDGAGIIYLILLILGSYYWAWLTFSYYSYSLENDGLHIHYGVLIKKHVFIQYNSIQDIDVYVNPFIARFLGLYYLHIKTRSIENTAGVVSHISEKQLPGMPLEVLNNLRIQLIAASHILAVKPRRYFDSSTGTYH